MTKKPKTKKRQPKITIKFNKSYWDKLAEAGCEDGLCEIKPK
jgi:hypothetical protein